MLLQTEVRRDGDTENTDVLARNDGVISMTQTRTGTIK